MQPERIGPLAGFQAGLAAATLPLVLFAPCDMPDLPLDLAAACVTHCRQADVAVAATAGRLQSVVLLAPTSRTTRASCAPHCRRRPPRRRLARRMNEPRWAFDAAQAFRNINTNRNSPPASCDLNRLTKSPPGAGLRSGVAAPGLALAAILREVRACRHRVVPLRESLGRIIAADLISPHRRGRRMTRRHGRLRPARADLRRTPHRGCASGSALAAALAGRWARASACAS